MPIEIREIVIRTEIVSSGKKETSLLKEKELHSFRKQLLEECRRMMMELSPKHRNKR